MWFTFDRLAIVSTWSLISLLAIVSMRLKQEYFLLFDCSMVLLWSCRLSDVVLITST